jgi:alcohol dehydrogenase class IV
MSETPTRGEFVLPSMDRVLYGPGTVASLIPVLEGAGGTRVLLVTSRSVVRIGLADRVASLLGRRLAGRVDDVGQFAPRGSVDNVVHAARRGEVDILLSLGGGSVIDTVKAAVLQLSLDHKVFLPHVAVPTTLSAAEFSPFFGVTDERTRTKSGASDPRLTPRAVILDAEVTLATPDWLWFGSGIRALDHAVETILAPDSDPLTDAGCLEAIRLIFRHLPFSGASSDAPIGRRQFCQVAAWLSFFGVGNITLGLSHSLGRKLGPRYDIPHGHTSAILLPHVMASTSSITGVRQTRIAAAARDRAEFDSRAEDAADAVRDLVAGLGLPTRLRDVGVPVADLHTLAAGDEKALAVLESAW